MAIETLLYLTIVAAALVVTIIRWAALQRIHQLETALAKLRVAHVALIERNDDTNELIATLRRDNIRLRANQLKWAGAVVALNSIHNLITAAKRNNQGSLATLTQIEQVLDDLGDSAPIHALDRPRPPSP